ASAGDRADWAAGILHDPGLLIGGEPSGGVYDEAAGLQGVLADVDFGLLGEDVAPERPGIHGGVDLLAIGHQRVTGQRVVMLPARQLANASDGAVDRTQPGTVAPAPDHALMIGRSDFSPTLDQGAVSIEQQLCVIERAAIALVDAD